MEANLDSLDLEMQNLKTLRSFGQIDIYREIQETLDQEFLITTILENSHFKRYPPAATFERSFWKWVIQTVERAGEVHLQSDSREVP